VCCDTPCDAPNEACDLPNARGTCTKIPAPAPALSNTGLVLAGMILAAIGAWALLRLRATRR